MSGTPKSLREAIDSGRVTGQLEVSLVEANVVDFLAQRFAAALLSTRLGRTEVEIEELWKAITGKSVEKARQK